MDVESVLPGWWEVIDEGTEKMYIGIAPEGKFELRFEEQLSDLQHGLRDLELSEPHIVCGNWRLEGGKIVMRIEEDNTVIPKGFRMATSKVFPIAGRLVRAYVRATYRRYEQVIQRSITAASEDELHTKHGELVEVWRRRTAPIL